MSDPFVDQLAALCRAHPTRAKWVFVPTHAVGRTLGERIALDSLFGGDSIAGTCHSRETSRRLRGKVLLVETLQRSLLEQGRVACQIDELSQDVPHNRVIKAAMLALATLPGIDTRHCCRSPRSLPTPRRCRRRATVTVSIQKGATPSQPGALCVLGQYRSTRCPKFHSPRQNRRAKISSVYRKRARNGAPVSAVCAEVLGARAEPV